MAHGDGCVRAHFARVGLGAAPSFFFQGTFLTDARVRVMSWTRRSLPWHMFASEGRVTCVRVYVCVVFYSPVCAVLWGVRCASVRAVRSRSEPSHRLFDLPFVFLFSLL